MEPIDGLGKLTHLLRSKAAGHTERRNRNADKTHTASPHTLTAATMPHFLRAKIREMQQHRATTDSIARRVISTMLSGTADSPLHDEPRFIALVARVQEHIEDDPALKTAFAQVMAQLNR